MVPRSRIRVDAFLILDLEPEARLLYVVSSSLKSDSELKFGW